jgi:UDP-2,4-diacetamido-2,4,6-trideoxy-beta-L-altropyranose hydrolase
MRVVFRVDASREIGTGHVMRCLTLARALPREARVEFVCRELDGDLCESVEACGYLVHRLPATSANGAVPERDVAETVAVLADEAGSRPAWLVVDHYGLDAAWEAALRPHADRIFAIDDLANRAHDCDLLLDQNYYEDAEARYASRVPESTRCLLGPRFALLRPEFAAARAAQREEPGVERLFVSFGGHDRYAGSARVAEALSLLGRDAPAADIVLGRDGFLRDKLAGLVEGLQGVELHGYVDDIARLMVRCTFAVGAGGSSTWERCALGLPALTIVAADNQRETTEDLARAGAIINLGEARDVSASRLALAIAGLRSNRERRESMGAIARALVDGHGALRVAVELAGARTCIS